MRNRNIHQKRRRSCVWHFGVFAMLAVSLAASTAGSARRTPINTVTAQARDTTDAPVTGAASGTLIIDGKEIKLKYVYARERNSRRNEPGAVIDLCISNQPLVEDILIRIAENRYHGSDKIRGVRLSVRPWKLDKGAAGLEYQSQEMGIGIGGDRGDALVSRVLDQSGPISDNNKQTKVLKDFKIEAGRVRGKAEYRGEDGIRSTAYSVLFDAPLKSATSESNSTRTATGGDQLPRDFQSFMLGKWTIERFRQENGLSHTGVLSVDERVGEDTLRGVFHIVVGGDGRRVEEEVIITRKGTIILMAGRVISGTGWSADNLAFELKNNLLVGSLTNENNYSGVLLKKMQ